MHDIGRKAEIESHGEICHAEKGAEMARGILSKHGYAKDLTDKVCRCIKVHRFRGEEKPETLEEKILFDADKLDSIGAIGIGRVFVFAGGINSRVHNKDIDIEKAEPYSKEDTAYREYLIKLSKLKDRMLTREGKRLAEGRDGFMKSFFERINREVDGEI